MSADPMRGVTVVRLKRRGPPPAKASEPPAPATAVSLAAELEALAERIARIRAVGRNGDLDPFYQDRSQARADARQLADWARTGRQPADFVPASRRNGPEPRTRYGERR